jgi:predicted permease
MTMRRDRTWFLRRAPDKEIDEEIAYHIDRRTEEYVAAGMDPPAARAEAMRRFGFVSGVRAETLRIDRAQARRESAGALLQALIRDVRVAVRGPRKSAGFTLTAMVCIALGICVTTTIFSAADAILFRPLPYPGADRLVAVYSQNVALGYHGTNISYNDYASWRDENQSFASLGIWAWVTKTITEGESERVPGASISANLFPLLGVRPVIGRTFLPEEERLSASDVVMLSYGLWQRRFGGDSGIVGRTIMMDGRPHRVAGIMPPHFNFPDRGEFWMPFAFDGPSRESHGDRVYAGAIGRLKPGVGFDAAQADLARVSRRLQAEFPQDNTGWAAELKTMREDLTGDLRKPMLVFLVAVALVLLIACANVANLMLARGMGRQREMAVRSALGAGRGDLVRQLMTESFVVVAGGGAIGAAVGVWAVRLARFAFPSGVPFYFNFGVDGDALGFAGFVIAMTAVLSSIVPALRATHVDINRSLRDGDRSGSAAASGRARATLVIGELALSTVLMVGGVLLLRSYRAYANTDLGFTRAGVLTARITLPEKRYDANSRRIALFEQLEARVRAIPGVTMVGSAQGIPFSGWNVQAAVSFLGRSPDRPNEEFISHYQSVFPDFFPAMGIPVIRGRALEASDRDTLAPVAVVNEIFAKRGFPGTDPIGKCVRFGGATSSDPWYTIVGVVRDFRQYRLPEPMGPALYTTYAVAPSRSQTLTIRTNVRDPYVLVPAVRSALRSLDPQLAMYDAKTMGDAVSQSLWRQRLQSEVLGVFALLALALAMVGIYGLISYSVAQRTREIGVRVALGATRGVVLRLVVAEGLRLLGIGLVTGVAAALLLSRALVSLLYGVSATDVITIAVVCAALTIMTLIATYVPALRAARVDPLIAMRAD